MFYAERQGLANAPTTAQARPEGYARMDDMYVCVRVYAYVCVYVCVCVCV